ncbi:NRAMP family divalent metal transporter [Oscillospiraceae bacterium LTW-04]|nr:divalent metal cation transporter [Oscillospiraceae bacterium MB24-C1]
MSNKENRSATSPAKPDKKNAAVLIGAAFLMATSAIGPGFLTQTTMFTSQYMASFSTVILCTIILDITTQVNVWRVIGVSGMRGQDVANKVLPGLGYFIAFLVALGGLAFNIGNVGGVSLGLNAMLGIPTKVGAVIGGIIAITIFLSKDAKKGMDTVTKVLGAIILLTILVVAVSSKPPVGEVAAKVFAPDDPIALFFPMITLLGGSCGGYITFSGAHRLLDAGISGKENLDQIQRSVTTGIAVSGTVRVLLFLAVLGVCTAGGAEAVGAIGAASNPAAEAFRLAAGEIGYRLFGVALFAAGTTSVIGAAFTSVSFLKTLHPFVAKNEKWFIVGFIAFSTLIMAILGGAKTLLVAAGSLNGLILPVTLGTMLLASRNKAIVGEDYKHPTWLIVSGALVVLLTGYVGIKALPRLLTIFG